jgi:feruloyl esterase
MGADTLAAFARLFVMPQAGHGLSGRMHTINGRGEPTVAAPIPNTFDRLGLLLDWVERNQAPGMSVTLTAGERSLPLCSYPTYPRYVGGAEQSAGSYVCMTGPSGPSGQARSIR